MLGRIDQNDLENFKNLFSEKLSLQGQAFFDTNIPMLRGIWSQVVGKEMAVHTLPLKISKKILQVRADHPIYLQQLQFHETHVLQKLSTLYNINLKGIHSHVGTIYWPLSNENAKRKDALSKQNSVTQEDGYQEHDELWQQLVQMLRNFQE